MKAPPLVALALLCLAPAAAAEPPSLFRILPDRSEIRILVYRAGLLSGLGHNHVIAGRGINGGIELGTTIEESSFDFAFPVISLQVDHPRLRRLEGDDFPGDIPAKDIAATRKNMLGSKLLDAEQFPRIRLVSQSVSGALPEVEISALVSVRDQTFPLDLVATVAIDGEELTATGELQMSHAEIGLKPFSAGFGALKVAREFTVKFEIVAVRKMFDGTHAANVHLPFLMTTTSRALTRH